MQPYNWILKLTCTVTFQIFTCMYWFVLLTQGQGINFDLDWGGWAFDFIYYIYLTYPVIFKFMHCIYWLLLLSIMGSYTCAT